MYHPFRRRGGYDDVARPQRRSRACVSCVVRGASRGRWWGLSRSRALFRARAIGPRVCVCIARSRSDDDGDGDGDGDDDAFG